MGHLKSASAILQAIGATAGGSSSVHNDPKFLAMLAGSTARISRMLETPLDRAGYSDIFVLDNRFSRKITQLRLAAGFVDPSGLRVIDPSGNTLNSYEYFLDSRLGVVTLQRPDTGHYKVVYNAGFASDGGDPPLLLDTPEWLQSIADQAALAWFRTITTTPKVGDNISYEGVMRNLYRDLAGTVYGTYCRPRSPAQFPIHTDISAVHSNGE